MAKGHDKERAVRRVLEEEGWWTCRAAGSLGDADLVACRPVLPPPGARVLLVEVKSNKSGGPYMNFRPSDRAELREAARRAGAKAVLAYWPARKPLQMIPADEWPT